MISRALNERGLYYWKNCDVLNLHPNMPGNGSNFSRLHLRKPPAIGACSGTFLLGIRTQLFELVGDSTYRKGVTASIVQATFGGCASHDFVPRDGSRLRDAPAHKAALVQEWLAQFCDDNNGIEPVNWPTYSTHLNPRENIGSY